MVKESGQYYACMDEKRERWGGMETWDRIPDTNFSELVNKKARQPKMLYALKFFPKSLDHHPQGFWQQFELSNAGSIVVYIYDKVEAA
jgi:hypothetical protein